MKINANYTWIKCKGCGLITKILPGQTFESADDFAELFKCNCVIEKPKRKKAVKNET